MPNDQSGRHAYDAGRDERVSSGFIARHVLGRDRGAVSQEPPNEALSANTAARAAEFDKLRAHAASEGLNFDPRRLGSPLDSAGEHTVYDVAKPSDAGRVFKVTHPGHAGITERALKLRDGTVRVMQDDALPSEYLDRWQLHNDMLGDSARYEGLMDGSHGPQMVMSQPIIKGAYPETGEISQALQTTRWQPTGDGHWQKRHEGQTIGLADTKAANFIRTATGAIHSIDAVPFVATDAMKETWPALTAAPHTLDAAKRNLDTGGLGDLLSGRADEPINLFAESNQERREVDG